MANNRMWLIYKPTGHAVCLAKRMAQGWYIIQPETLGAAIERFLDAVDKAQIEARVLCNGGQDEFALGLEVPGDNPHSFNNWQYSTDQEPGQVRVLKLIDRWPPATG